MSLSLTAAGQCTWPSGAHKFRNGSCTRCATIEMRADGRPVVPGLLEPDTDEFVYGQGFPMTS